MEITEVFGKNLRVIRNARSMSAELLGEKSGVSGKHIYDIEKNIKKPSFDLVVSIAKALDVKIGDLFEPDESAPVLPLPVSKTLQKLMAIPDRIYDLAQEIPLNDSETWGLVETTLEHGIEKNKLARLHKL